MGSSFNDPSLEKDNSGTTAVFKIDTTTAAPKADTIAANKPYTGPAKVIVGYLTPYTSPVIVIL